MTRQVVRGDGWRTSITLGIQSLEMNPRFVSAVSINAPVHCGDHIRTYHGLLPKLKSQPVFLSNPYPDQRLMVAIVIPYGYARPYARNLVDQPRPHKNMPIRKVK